MTPGGGGKKKIFAPKWRRRPACPLENNRNSTQRKSFNGGFSTDTFLLFVDIGGLIQTSVVGYRRGLNCLRNNSEAWASCFV